MVGSDRRLVDYVVSTWYNGVCCIHGKEIHLSELGITKAMGIPNRVKIIKHDSKVSKVDKIQKFEGDRISLEQYKMGFYRKSLPYPWYRICKIPMKYITLHGRHIELYGSHIILMNQFKPP